VDRSDYLKKDKTEGRGFAAYHDREGLRNYLLLFIVWPFMTTVLALLNYKRGYTKHILTLFCGFIGMLLLIRGSTDGVRYQEQFLRIANYSFPDIWIIIKGYILEQAHADISREVIFFMISRFTTELVIMWAIIGLMFGYIYSKNIWYLFGHVNDKMNLNALLFLAAFLLIITPTQGTNQFRFWIAAHVFFYGAVNVVMYKRPAYFIISFMAPLFHFGMFLPNLGLLLFYFAGRRDSIYIPVAIFSAFFAEFELQILSDYIGMLGPGIESRFEGYTSDRAFDRAEDLQERSWFMVVWQPLLLYMTYGMLAYVHLKLKKGLSEPLLNYFSFMLILVTIINLVSHFPMIYRYLPVLFLFMFAFLFLLYIHMNNEKVDVPVLFCIPPILLMMVVQTRIMFDFVDATILISNPVIFLLGISEISLFEFIR
jgi:hypothetical protein